MKKVFFILGIHSHQPIGNFDFVFTEAFQKAYLPFLKILSAHPSIKVCLHYSGILWEWLEKNSPQVIDLCKMMLERRQIELLSGGFYEPILSIIPDQDKLGQMKMMCSFINQKLGSNPKGLWLAERVWEPNIPKFVYEAGLEYVVVDDLHFMAAGLEAKQLHGYYLTDDQGKVIKVFPGSKKLRYLIPFKSPEMTEEYLRSISRLQIGDLAVMADDGEKFGIWPGTYDWVYKKEWLENFFKMIENNMDWLRMCTFSEYIAEHSPLGQVYLPTASYSEMEEWALPLNTQRIFHSLVEKLNHEGSDNNSHNFVRGGLWRNFICKYKEANNIYNRMLQVSQKIENLEKLFYGDEKKGKLPEWILNAKNEVWKGQCNDAYWHGLFGGLYLPHLRAALYNHLIQADNIIENQQHSKSTWVEWEMKDMDQDGFDELKINTDKYCLYIDPNSGGAIYEWDFRSKCVNVINTLMRRPESYHQKIINHSGQDSANGNSEVKSIHDIEQFRVKGLEKLLIYDKYCRNSLLDHFFNRSVAFNDFSSLQYQEIGDFLNKPYELKLNGDSERLEVVLSRTANIDSSGELTLSKSLIVSSGSPFIKISYSLCNSNLFPINAIFGVEFNFNLLAGHSKDRYFLIDSKIPQESYLASKGELKNIERLCIVDESIGLEIGINVNRRSDLWHFPIETASNSEGGFEKVFQGSVLLFHWPISLQKGETEKYDLDCWIREIGY